MSARDPLFSCAALRLMTEMGGERPLSANTQMLSEIAKADIQLLRSFPIPGSV